ncbi:hypothetical protein PPERSA_09080 [Pseudocohnilembus persalinus]|uniref:Uncharacterized protein n=1 Tax=Pseudocohnilembus persalinus TaxID=266149 RepID=A0A0V0Q7D6_PSEPJ|nr:hypothetical protein PPERSA_09080 [Pseudocohnilembus persalinus]|eukprot:KRW98140.1 hypothetical protein PPERSA_09080 [Pseudocohnilembus persalinus]
MQHSQNDLSKYRMESDSTIASFNNNKNNSNSQISNENNRQNQFFQQQQVIMPGLQMLLPGNKGNPNNNTRHFSYSEANTQNEDQESFLSKSNYNQENTQFPFWFQNDQKEKGGKVQYIISDCNSKAICNLSKKVMAISAVPLMQKCDFKIVTRKNKQIIVGLMVVDEKVLNNGKITGYSQNGTLMYQEDGQLVINNKGIWENIAVVPTFVDGDIISFEPGDGKVYIYKNQAQVGYWKFSLSYHILRPMVEFTTHLQAVQFV